MIYDLDLANSGITLRDNVKGKEKLYTGKVGDVWQSYTCPFTPSGEASLAESFIEPDQNFGCLRTSDVLSEK